MEGKDLRVLAAEIKQYSQTEQIRLMRRFFLARIDYLREKSDTVTAEDLPKHQGAIAELKELLKVTKFNNQLKEFDGAFGE